MAFGRISVATLAWIVGDAGQPQRGAQRLFRLHHVPAPHLLMVLVNILGVLCCIVGLLVSIPVTFAAITAAYQELVGFDPQTPDRV